MGISRTEITRRTALLATATTAGLGRFLPNWSHPARQTVSGFGPAAVYSITPVVSDGVWVWDQQPENEKGVLDGREFEVSVGVRWSSDGTVRTLGSSTVAPVAFPEQEILQFEIQKSDECEAEVVPLTETSAQLQVTAPFMERGQVIEAKAVYRMRLSRFCPHYDSGQFPARQVVPQEVAGIALGNSPGIRSDLNSVKKIVDTISSRNDHPWETAKKFHTWVWENIKGVPGPYTSVRKAIKNGTGDCEERAGVFVALCRAAGIPARLVWVPNHCWAEFYLHDSDGVGHWIPSHTAAYNWFGWTGAHELVLQKGDRIPQTGQNAYRRLITDWYTFEGRRPKIEFYGSVVPVATTGNEPGPGKREKIAEGGWDLVGDHSFNRRLRR